MNAVAVQASIYALIREELEGDEADPHVIAQNMVASMSEEDMRMALIVALPETIRRLIHSHRTRTAKLGSERWSTVADLQASGELALLRARVFAQGAWKFLGDCTREDVQSVAEDREELAARNAAVAAQFRAVEAAMWHRRAETVRELPGAVLNEIFA